ncbi:MULTISPECIES: heme exporter protein CcmD [Pasteurellaceae]|uniref:Heme exporter protein D n=1 Tax=Pasteurella atlantica TaxID=2827233 RepID=A0AAW8CGK1_9PAST|nr:heme exporter protein CcmD [Pasteurella atlantica]MBR0573188.1 heme exporter protein CcmD [Pasteurella atlantica]MDP8039196.1 heme exporter protein CcmD [Pasteurella atlantica]MDP8041205.1 heme exporter protein CcmD [Pasteurella atlantica]MDP8043342.1 heme exporter protein CcmD [Pasteurella atlantica]MDP8045428.1 heme exporter protein CcmD [Pasteurella atlantica]
MFFQSWSDFFNMGGYGFYVWIAYGISFVAILVLGLQSISSKKALFKEIKREQERKQRQQNMRGNL